MQSTTQRTRGRLLPLAGVLMMSTATLLSAGGTAAAAPAPAPGEAAAGVQAATLGQTCTGPSYNRRFAFTVTSTTGVPAGSTWTFSVSQTSWSGLKVASSSSRIPSAQGTTRSVNLSATSSVPAGTTVTLTPSNYLVPSNGSNTLTLSGYGGSTSISLNTGNQPC